MSDQAGTALDRELVDGVTLGEMLDALEQQPDLVEDLLRGLTDIVAAQPQGGRRP